MPFTKRNLRNISRLFFGLPKTLIFNFYYFGLSGIFRPRVILTKSVYLRKLGGVVRVPPHIGVGEIKIGFGDVGIFDDKRSRTVWDVLGEVHSKGRCLIGHGSKISVRGALFFGQDVHITAETQIVARKKVVLEDGVLISWDCLITDSDYHVIRSVRGKLSITTKR